ncbi:MAG: type III restriction endonuclease subunit R [Candidatus Omnitrophota bacterium]|jgi:type III restriction enzyme|nr:MAG: type III restriction endonuclease subunit R [Candidatus Omnitrophota bacterium]
MSNFEVSKPILNTPYEEPKQFWYLREDEEPELRSGRRPSIVYPPSDTPISWDFSDGILYPSEEFSPGYEMRLVNHIRNRVKEWRNNGFPGVGRITRQLMEWWRREGRQFPLFFAQLEAVETVIFLREARQDFLQGITIPFDEPSENQRADGAKAFLRYACKMATGTGKTTVMGMLIAWNILNKVNDRTNAKFSDVALVVCPNITIKNRLNELIPENGEASIYRTRDLVPPELTPQLTQGRVLVTNWHIFERREMQVGETSAKVSRAGVPIRTTEKIQIGQQTTTARGRRYLTPHSLQMQVAAGILTVLEESRDSAGNLKSVLVESFKYVESDTAWVNRVLGKDIGGKQNILILNDEAHHAYRIRQETDEEGYEEEGEEEFYKEATVWIEGLDRIHKIRGINFCMDLSATPYYLGRVGQDTNKPFPWVVSDFGLTDAIEAGLVKIPQLALRDPTGSKTAKYFNLWKWILEQLTPSEKGGKKGSPKPEAILKYAHTPIALLGGEWEKTLREWEKNEDDPRPPVFIIVCKNTAIAKVLYEWLAENRAPTGIPPANIESFRNRNGKVNTIRVDSKVISETDTEGAKSDETLWMRFTLDTIGKREWPADRQSRPIFPEGFEILAQKLNRPLHPPGRDVRCIVSVGMLTEGWDCNTVTHIIGLRPFMSQLLCEQVVGRGLRRTNYVDFDEEGKLSEETAEILGVPFEVIPYKATTVGPPKPQKRKHVHAIPDKEQYKIEFPRVEGYTQAIRNTVTVDWDHLPELQLDPTKIPPEVELKASLPTNQGRPSLAGPGKLDRIDLNPYRQGRRYQELLFDIAGGLTKDYLEYSACTVPSHILFPQLLKIGDRYMQEKVKPLKPAELIDVFLSPYYGWVIERLVHAIRPDTTEGEAPEIPKYEKHRGPGSTTDVDFWTGKEVRDVERSHVNRVVADTKKWEQSAAYFIDTHPSVEAFVKNAGLGFAIPYIHDGQPHDYIPDFIIRLKSGKKSDPPRYLILETKGYDELETVKHAAAQRWIQAVNADGNYGQWDYAIARKPTEAREIINLMA